MTETWSFLFNILTDPLGLPISPIWEYVVLACIEFGAYILAFRIVGLLYQYGDLCTNCGGSALHWILRLIVFFLIWAVSYGLIAFIKFITTHWAIVLIVLGAIIVLILVIALVFILRKKGRNAK